MRHLVRYTSESGGSACFEVEEQGPIGQQFAGAGDTIVNASQKLEEALDSVEPFLSALSDRFKHAAVAASEISMELGIKFTAGAGVIIASCSTEGNCKVSFKWTKQ